MFAIDEMVAYRLSGQVYIGKIKKIVTDSSGTTYFIRFDPKANWTECVAGSLDRVAVTINPPTMDFAPAIGDDDHG